MPWSITEIHPLLVHFPIALYSTGLLFDIISRFNYQSEMESAGFWIMGVAVLSSIFTIAAGFIAFADQGNMLDIFKFTHGLLEITANLLLYLLFYLRFSFQLELRFSIAKQNVFLLFHSLAVGILFYGAHLGAIAAERF